MVEIDDNNEIYEERSNFSMKNLEPTSNPEGFHELTITDIKMLLEYTQFKNNICFKHQIIRTYELCRR